MANSGKLFLFVPKVNEPAANRFWSEVTSDQQLTQAASDWRENSFVVGHRWPSLNRLDYDCVQLPEPQAFQWVLGHGFSASCRPRRSSMSTASA
jgi:hypothetical protein